MSTCAIWNRSPVKVVDVHRRYPAVTSLKKDLAIRVEHTLKITYSLTWNAPKNTGEHLINLAIAQDFQGNQYEFTSQKDFCDWVFRKEHIGYTFIAHNLKGYDMDTFY